MNIPSEQSTQNALLQNNLSGYYNNRSYAEQMAQQKLEYSGIGEAIASSLIAKSNLGNISITGDDLMSVGRSLVPDFSNFNLPSLPPLPSVLSQPETLSSTFVKGPIPQGTENEVLQSFDSAPSNVRTNIDDKGADLEEDPIEVTADVKPTVTADIAPVTEDIAPITEGVGEAVADVALGAVTDGVGFLPALAGVAGLGIGGYSAFNMARGFIGLFSHENYNRPTVANIASLPTIGY